jgi:hypothetical protein
MGKKIEMKSAKLSCYGINKILYDIALYKLLISVKQGGYYISYNSNCC